MQLGIVTGGPHVVRAARLADVTRLVGGGPSGDDLAWHAAAHALMNGVARVISGPLDGVLSHADVGCVVMPGAPIAAQRAAADQIAGGLDVTLFLDPAADDVADAAAFRRALPDTPRVRVVVPRSWSLTPGGPARWLPGSCLIGPLALGATQALKPMHTLDRDLDPSAVDALADAGCDVLVARGRRALVTLARPLPALSKPAATSHPPTEDPLQRALREATEPLIDGQPDGPALWRSLERVCRDVMRPYERSGALTVLVVRCDAETHSWANAPAVEVVYRTPLRVKQVHFTVSQG